MEMPKPTEDDKERFRVLVAPWVGRSLDLIADLPPKAKRKKA